MSGTRWLWPSAAGLALAGVGAWIVTQIGAGGALAGLPIAAAVTAVVVAALRWLGRGAGRERRGLLISAFLWGASFAALGAIFSQRWLQQLTDALGGKDFSRWFHPLVTTPVTEEVFKALFLLWLLVARRRQIRGLLDGIVLGGLAGAGFAFSENVFYLGGAIMKFTAGGEDAATVLGVTFFLRLVLVPFMHPFFVAIAGLGVAASYRSRVFILLGLLAAVALHGVWDYAGLASADHLLIFRIYGAVMVPLFVALLVTALVLRRRSAR
ncbi:PrsW family intramembrane metalloprotease [Actinoplanes sp. NPDC049596]|uniref:PrsW family intramembrane metalloprotease n=1 Tax=unclassified Actinoplanes TaxID=2626549 RepID=UPI00342E8826